MHIVLNQQGRDPFCDYRGGYPGPETTEHPPINYHAYAACTQGCFCQTVEQVLDLPPAPVIVLVRNKLKPVARALRILKAAKRRTYLCFKETGIHQLHPLLSQWRRLQELAALADGGIAPTDYALLLLRALFPEKPAELLPTPYPFHDPRWQTRTPWTSHSGVLIGTTEFEVTNRRHLAAILSAREVCRQNGEILRVIARRLPKPVRDLLSNDPNIEILPGPLPYFEFRKQLERVKVVFQLDASQVPGQVAGDSFLVGTPCLGGNSTIESLLLEPSQDPLSMLDQLLRTPDTWSEVVNHGLERAKQTLSFPVLAKRLQGMG